MAEILKKTKEIPQPSKGIEPLKLKAVNSIRGKIMSTLKRMAVITTLSAGVGGIVGDKIQDSYRDMTGYDPAKIEATENPESEIGDSTNEGQEIEKEALSWKEKAAQKLRGAKEWAGRKINNAAEKSELVQKVKETQSELKKMYNGLLEAGDKTAFWLPFLFTFLATALLTNKLIQVKKDLFEEVDPVVAKNMEAIEKKINEIIGQIETGEKIKPEDVQGLLNEYFENANVIETAQVINQKSVDSEADHVS